VTENGSRPNTRHVQGRVNFRAIQLAGRTWLAEQCQMLKNLLEI